jgi:hypothetical protein
VAELADEVLGDLLNVHVKTSWWWSLGMTWMLVALRGIEQMMYDLQPLGHRPLIHLRNELDSADPSQRRAPKLNDK